MRPPRSRHANRAILVRAVRPELSTQTSNEINSWMSIPTLKPISHIIQTLNTHQIKQRTGGRNAKAGGNRRSRRTWRRSAGSSQGGSSSSPCRPSIDPIADPRPAVRQSRQASCRRRRTLRRGSPSLSAGVKRLVEVGTDAPVSVPAQHRTLGPPGRGVVELNAGEVAVALHQFHPRHNTL